MSDPDWSSLAQNGVDHLTAASTPETASTERWVALFPANSTTPLINQSGTEVKTGDKPADGQEVLVQGLYFPYTTVDLSQGEVYAIRG